MKTILTVMVLMGIVATAQAEWVNGYLRRDGTYVGGYYRTDRDGIEENNLSYHEHSDTSYTPQREPDMYDQLEQKITHDVDQWNKESLNRTLKNLGLEPYE